MKFSKAKANPQTPNTKKPNAKQIDIAIPTFGYKDHISIDQGRGFIRKWEVTDASRYDGYELENLIDPDNSASIVWGLRCLGNTAYGSKANRKMLEQRGLKAHIHTRKPKGVPMSEQAAKANSKRSKIRAFVEHPFAHLKGPMRLFIRTIGIDRATTKIGMANLAYNFRRYIFHEVRAA